MDRINFDLVIKKGHDFSVNELRSRLTQMDISFNQDKQTKANLSNLYDTSLKEPENINKLRDRLINDTEEGTGKQIEKRSRKDYEGKSDDEAVEQNTTNKRIKRDTFTDKLSVEANTTRNPNLSINQDKNIRQTISYASDTNKDKAKCREELINNNTLIEKDSSKSFFITQDASKKLDLVKDKYFKHNFEGVVSQDAIKRNSNPDKINKDSSQRDNFQSGKAYSRERSLSPIDKFKMDFLNKKKLSSPQDFSNVVKEQFITNEHNINTNINRMSDDKSIPIPNRVSIESEKIQINDIYTKNNISTNKIQIKSNKVSLTDNNDQATNNRIMSNLNLDKFQSRQPIKEKESLNITDKTKETVYNVLNRQPEQPQPEPQIKQNFIRKSSMSYKEAMEFNNYNNNSKYMSNQNESQQPELSKYNNRNSVPNQPNKDSVDDLQQQIRYSLNKYDKQMGLIKNKTTTNSVIKEENYEDGTEKKPVSTINKYDLNNNYDNSNMNRSEIIDSIDNNPNFKQYQQFQGNFQNQPQPKIEKNIIEKTQTNDIENQNQTQRVLDYTFRSMKSTSSIGSTKNDFISKKNSFNVDVPTNGGNDTTARPDHDYGHDVNETHPSDPSDTKQGGFPWKVLLMTLFGGGILVAGYLTSPNINELKEFFSKILPPISYSADTYEGLQKPFNITQILKENQVIIGIVVIAFIILIVLKKKFEHRNLVREIFEKIKSVLKEKADNLDNNHLAHNAIAVDTIIATYSEEYGIEESDFQATIMPQLEELRRSDRKIKKVDAVFNGKYKIGWEYA